MMMPSKFRLASATAAGLVGLLVAGLILFDTDPLGMGATDVALPVPEGAAASRTPVEADAERDDRSTTPPNRRPRPRPRPEPTSWKSVV